MMKRNYREVKDNPALGYISQMSVTSEEEKKETTEPQSLETVLQEASSIEITPTPEGYKIPRYYYRFLCSIVGGCCASAYQSFRNR